MDAHGHGRGRRAHAVHVSSLPRVGLASARLPGRVSLTRDRRDTALALLRHATAEGAEIHGFTGEVALHAIAAMELEVIELLLALDPFGDHAHPEAVGQTDDRVGDRSVRDRMRHAVHE